MTEKFGGDKLHNERKPENLVEKYSRINDAVAHAMQTLSGLKLSFQYSKSREDFYNSLNNAPFLFFEDGLKNFGHDTETTLDEVKEYFGDIKDIYNKSMSEVINNHNLSDGEIIEILSHPIKALIQIKNEKNLL